MKMKLMRRVLLSCALAIGAGLVAGCRQAAAGDPMPPPDVTVAPVQQKEIIEWSEFTGQVEPVQSVNVRPRVSGYIQKVCFQSGQLVKTGDVLFVIDPRWNQAVFDQRQAEYEQAKREEERTAQLLASQAISAEEADARRFRYQEAGAQLDAARLDLEYTQVRAPIDGRVSRALLTAGNYVSGIAGSASLLTTIVSVSPVYVYANMDEDSYLKFSELVRAKELGGDDGGKIPVEMELEDEQGFPHAGYVESFDNHLNPDTGSILLRAVFQNTNGSLVPGLFARIRIPLSDRHPALLVNDRAIGTDQSQKYVLTLTPTNTVAYQPVELGPLVDGQRVIRSGLYAGQEIVVDGLERVRPGMPVKPGRETLNASVAGQETARR